MRHLRPASLKLSIFFLALLAVPAQAAVLYVSPTGTGTACTAGSPCAMATANSNVRAGDVVRVNPGVYTTAPDPGVSGTPTARITYFGNLAIPDAALISPGMTLKRKYITVKGMSFGGSVYFDRLSASPGQCAQFDSLAYANVYHTLGMNQAKDCMAYMVNVTSGLGRFTMSTPATPVADWTTPERDTIRRCTFHLGEQVTDGYHIVQFRGVTNCVIDSNQVNIQMAPNLVNEIDPFIAFYMRNSEFKDNRWRVKHSGGNHLFRWRDSTMFNRVYRDSIILFGSGNLRFAPSSAGSYVGTTTQNYFNGLYVKCSTNPSDYALYYQNGMRRDTLINCVVIDSLGKAFTNGQVEKGTSLIDHCTFVGNSTYGVAETLAGINQWGVQWAADGRLVFTNNLIYQLKSGGAGTEIGKNWQFSSASDQLVSNGNLYFLPGKSASRAIAWNVNGGNSTFVTPGSVTGSWATTYGRDINSYWGSPRFLDSTFTNFDPRPGPGSYAIGRALDGTTIGARQPSGPDASPPSTISNLNATEIYDNKVWLTWSAPGDDGAIGVSQTYELRYSTTAITAANFTSATAVSPQPVPLPSGSAQSYLVPGLSAGVNYYFAIRARDDAGNWSAISNVRQAMTTSADVRAPAAVKDLIATP